MRFIVHYSEFWWRRVPKLSLSSVKYCSLPFRILQCLRFKTSSVSDTLEALGIKKTEIYTHLKLLNVTPEELNERTEILADKVTNKDELLNLITLPIRDIKKYLQVRNNEEKIQGLSEVLKCSTNETMELFARHTFFLRSRLGTIKEKVDILLNGGISLDDLKRDLWILTYPKKHIQSRLEVIKENNIHPIRPWMLRCQLNALLRAKINKDENLQAMAPYTSPKQYVCERLNISVSQYDDIIKKYPPFANVQVVKFKEILNFLLYEGFTAEQICRTPRVFSHSVDTIKDRLAELKKINYFPSSVSTLCKNKKDFYALVSRIKKKQQKGT